MWAMPATAEASVSVPTPIRHRVRSKYGPSRRPIVGNSLIFVTAARGANGVALITYQPGEEVVATAIAHGLVNRGVRHFGGAITAVGVPPGEVLFVDERPLSPDDLTPVSSFSFFSLDDAISRWWLSRRARPRFDLGGNLVVDVLLVPSGARIGRGEVGRDLPCIAGVTAVELLGRK